MGLFINKSHVAKPLSVYGPERDEFGNGTKVIVVVDGNCVKPSLAGDCSLNPPHARGGHVVCTRYMYDADKTVVEYRFCDEHVITHSDMFVKKISKQLVKASKAEMNKKVLPVSVSGCTPVYVNGRIKWWTVHVFFNGDLSINTTQRNKWRELIDKNPHLVHENGIFLRPVIRPDIIMPKKGNWSSYFKYHADKNMSEIEYAWRNGLFDCGGERAWQFRIKMLAQIAKNQARGM